MDTTISSRRYMSSNFIGFISLSRHFSEYAAWSFSTMLWSVSFENTMLFQDFSILNSRREKYMRDQSSRSRYLWSIVLVLISDFALIPVCFWLSIVSIFG